MPIFSLEVISEIDVVSLLQSEMNLLSLPDLNDSNSFNEEFFKADERESFEFMLFMAF